MGERAIELRPLSGAMGAEIHGVDLAKPLEAPVFAEVERAFVDYGAIFFRGQDLSHEAQLDFARRFGPLDVHPIVDAMDGYPELVRVLKPAGELASFGVGWHSDNSFLAEPSLGSMLHARVVPPYGGDTLFASMELAYQALSDTMRRMLEDLVAVHSAGRAYDPATTGEAKYRGEAAITYHYSDQIHEEVEHPVIRSHPESGRKSLYVNQMFTQRICGLRRAESEALLGFLYEHCARPEFTCRFRWEAGSLALWDNRSVQHYALDDYRDFERLLYRVTISGTKPV